MKIVKFNCFGVKKGKSFVLLEIVSCKILIFDLTMVWYVCDCAGIPSVTGNDSAAVVCFSSYCNLEVADLLDLSMYFAKTNRGENDDSMPKRSLNFWWSHAAIL